MSIYGHDVHVVNLTFTEEKWWINEINDGDADGDDDDIIMIIMIIMIITSNLADRHIQSQVKT